MRASVLLLTVLPFVLTDVPVNLYTDALHLFGIDPSQMSLIVSELARTLETNYTDAACESKCNEVVPHIVHQDNMTALLSEFCPLTCQTLEPLAHQLNIHVIG